MARVPLQFSGAPDQAAAGAGPEAGDLHPLLREHVEMRPSVQLHPSAGPPLLMGLTKKIAQTGAETKIGLPFLKH